MNKLNNTSAYAIGLGMSASKVCYGNTPTTKGQDMNEEFAEKIAKIIAQQASGLITNQEMVDEILEATMIFSNKLPDEVVPEWVSTSTFRAEGFDD